MSGMKALRKFEFSLGIMWSEIAPVKARRSQVLPTMTAVGNALRTQEDSLDELWLEAVMHPANHYDLDLSTLGSLKGCLKLRQMWTRLNLILYSNKVDVSK